MRFSTSTQELRKADMTGLAPDRSVLTEFIATAEGIPFEAVPPLASEIDQAPRIYLHGLGRCGLVLRAFAIRLAQYGLPVHLVGGPVTLAARAGDLLISGSGSGGTSGTVNIATRARAEGLRVIALTATRGAPLDQVAAWTILLPGVSKDDPGSATRSVQPPGSLFEQMLMCFLEQCVVEIGRHRDPDYRIVRRQHANLE